MQEQSQDFIPERDRAAAADATVPAINVAPFFKDPVSSEGRDVVAQVAHACETIGFFVITGHGVSEDAINKIKAESDNFFTRPVDFKMAIKRPAPGVSRGYNRLADQSLAQTLGDKTPPDLMESLGFGPLKGGKGAYFEDGNAPIYFHSNLWPEGLPTFKAAVESYYGEMEKLADNLCQIFALALGKDKEYFKDKIDRHVSTMRINYYPAQQTAPLPGQIRAGAHSDYDAFTILKTGSGGLQVVRRGGDWVDVPVVPNGYVINIGDMLMRWTNDRWVSTLHRVVNPPAEARNQSRLSIAFFQIPNHDVVLDGFESCVGPDNPQRYTRTTAGEHWLGKILAARVKD
jgi:isopenicillin N synthase-like dioxygenase